MKIITKLYKHTLILLIIATLLVIAYFMKAIPECVMMMVAFLIARRKYQFSYHCKSAVQCFVLSIAIFVVGIRVVSPIGISYLCCGLYGLFLAYGFQHLAKLNFIRKDYEYIEPRYEQLLEENHKKSIYSMSEQELRIVCKENLFDAIDEEIVVQRLIYGRKGKELYDKIGYSKPQMIRREKRIEQKLNIKLKER